MSLKNENNTDIHKMGIIYLYISPSFKFYIGQTTRTFIIRNKDHIKDSNRFIKTKYQDGNVEGCNAFYNAIGKYGIHTFTTAILIECDNSHLDIYEKFFIKQYNSLAPNGYNLTEGGQNGIVFSDVTLKKMSISRKNYTIRAGDKIKKTTAGIGLPMFMAFYKQDSVEGYKIYKHPLCITKKFSSTRYVSLANAKNSCLEFLKLLNDIDNPYTLPQRVYPKGISKRGHGYRVRIGHNKQTFDQTFMDDSDDETNFNNSYQYYNDIKSGKFDKVEIVLPKNIYPLPGDGFIVKINTDGIKTEKRFVDKSRDENFANAHIYLNEIKQIK